MANPDAQAEVESVKKVYNNGDYLWKKRSDNGRERRLALLSIMAP